MLDYRKAYLVEIKKLKEDAKAIKKQNVNSKITHTQILDIFVQSLKFKDFNEYEKALNNRSHFILVPLKNLKIHEIYELRYILLQKFISLDIEINNIFFIDNIINSKMREMKNHDGFSMITYLYCLPYLLKCNELACIDLNDASINKDRLKALLSMLVDNYKSNNSYLYDSFTFINAKYRTRNLFDVHDALKVCRNLYFGSNTLSKYKNDYRELFFAIKNDYDEGNYKEGLIFEKLKEFNNDLISLDDIVDFIEQEVEDELVFKNKFNCKYDIAKPNRTIYVPSFNSEQKNQKNTLDVIAEMSNNFIEHEPLFIGKREINKIFKKTEYLRITKEQMNENILISGCAGSGATVAAYSFVMQSLKSGRGFIYLNTFGDYSVYAYLYGIIKIFNRESDVILLSVNHKKELLKLDINKLVSKNKILIISCHAIEKTSEEEHENILKSFNNLLSRIQNKKQSFYPYSVFINHFFYMGSNEYDEFKKQILRLNKLNICFVASAQSDSVFNKKPSITNIFNNVILMKSEAPHELEVFDLNGVSLRDFKSLSVGEFFFMRDDKVQYKNIYKLFYIDAYIEDSPFDNINNVIWSLHQEPLWLFFFTH